MPSVRGTPPGSGATPGLGGNAGSGGYAGTKRDAPERGHLALARPAAPLFHAMKRDAVDLEAMAFSHGLQRRCSMRWTPAVRTPF